MSSLLHSFSFVSFSANFLFASLAYAMLCQLKCKCTPYKHFLSTQPSMLVAGLIELREFLAWNIKDSNGDLMPVPLLEDLEAAFVNPAESATHLQVHWACICPLYTAAIQEQQIRTILAQIAGTRLHLQCSLEGMHNKLSCTHVCGLQLLQQAILLDTNTSISLISLRTLGTKRGSRVRIIRLTSSWLYRTNLQLLQPHVPSKSRHLIISAAT